MKMKIIRKVLTAIVAAATIASTAGVASAGGMDNNYRFIGHKRPRDNGSSNINNNINNNNNLCSLKSVEKSCPEK